MLLLVSGRERNISQMPPICVQPGREPTIWVCSLTWNRTCNPSVHGTTLQPTELHQKGSAVFECSFISYCLCDLLCASLYVSLKCDGLIRINRTNSSTIKQKRDSAGLCSWQDWKTGQDLGKALCKDSDTLIRNLSIICLFFYITVILKPSPTSWWQRLPTPPHSPSYWSPQLSNHREIEFSSSSFRNSSRVDAHSVDWPHFRAHGSGTWQSYASHVQKEMSFWLARPRSHALTWSQAMWSSPTQSPQTCSQEPGVEAGQATADVHALPEARMLPSSTSIQPTISTSSVRYMFLLFLTWYHSSLDCQYHSSLTVTASCQMSALTFMLLRGNVSARCQSTPSGHLLITL